MMLTTMFTKAQVLRDRSEYKQLINAVTSRVGLDSVEDINNHGIDSGYGGFIYYADTHKFAMRYRKQIVSLLEEYANDFGEDVVSMVSNFRCVEMDADDRRDLYKYLGGGRPEQCQITNAMAWFAAEEVCRWFDN